MTTKLTSNDNPDSTTPEIRRKVAREMIAAWIKGGRDVTHPAVKTAPIGVFSYGGVDVEVLTPVDGTYLVKFRYDKANRLQYDGEMALLDETPAAVAATPETNTSGKPMRVRIYVAFNGISGTLYFPVKIVESGNMRTVFTSDTLATSQRWITDNGYTEAHAPYYSKEVTAQIANNKVRAATPAPVAPAVTAQPAPEVKPASGKATAITYRSLNSAQPRLKLSGGKVEAGEFDCMDDNDLCVEERLLDRDIEDELDTETRMNDDWHYDTDDTRAQAEKIERLYQKRDRIWAERDQRDSGVYPDSIMKPEVVRTAASTVLPALATPERVIRLPLLSTIPLLPSGNRAIALLPAYCPIALPSDIVEIAGTEYRITTHGKIISIEKLVNGKWQHEANYGTPEQVKRFLERMERESNQPTNFTPERIASEKTRMEKANLDYQAFYGKMYANKADGKYRRHAAQLSKDSETLHDLDKRRQQLETTYKQMVHLASPEPPPPAPAQVATPAAPLHKLTAPLAEALGVLFSVPSDVDPKHRCHVWNDKRRGIECRPADNFYRLPEKLAMGLVGLGFAKRTNASAIIITDSGRAAWREYATANKNAQDLVVNYHKRTATL